MAIADGEDLPHARVVKETIAVHDPATGVTSHTTTTHKKLLTKEFLVLLLFMLIIKFFGGKIDLNTL